MNFDFVEFLDYFAAFRLQNLEVYTKVDILRPLKKSEKYRGSALNLSQAKPASKQLNIKYLAMQTGLKFSG